MTTQPHAGLQRIVAAISSNLAPSCTPYCLSCRGSQELHGLAQVPSPRHFQTFACSAIWNPTNQTDSQGYGPGDVNRRAEAELLSAQPGKKNKKKDSPVVPRPLPAYAVQMLGYFSGRYGVPHSRDLGAAHPSTLLEWQGGRAANRRKERKCEKKHEMLRIILPQSLSPAVGRSDAAACGPLTFGTISCSPFRWYT